MSQNMEGRKQGANRNRTRIVQSVGALVAAALVLAQPVAAQDYGAECRRLAGSPKEPNNPDKIGVQLDEIDTVRAIDACTKALVPQFTDPVAAYRLARAYYAIGPRQDVREAIYNMRIVRFGAERYADQLGAEAAKWYVSAAKENLTPATYEKAAEAGDLTSQMMLAWMYAHKSIIGLQDVDVALSWMKRAAEQDHPPAIYQVGVLYAWHGRDQEAFPWYKRAAQKNWEPAIFSLGIAYAYGNGTPQDAKRGFEIIGTLANAGNVGAQIALGHLFLKGVGTEENPQLARRWYKMAADNGSQEAANLLKQTENHGDISEKAALAALALLGLAILLSPSGSSDTSSGSSSQEETKSCEPCSYGETEVYANQCQNMDSGALRSKICY